MCPRRRFLPAVRGQLPAVGHGSRPRPWRTAIFLPSALSLLMGLGPRASHVTPGPVNSGNASQITRKININWGQWKGVQATPGG